MTSVGRTPGRTPRSARGPLAVLLHNGNLWN